MKTNKKIVVSLIFVINILTSVSEAVEVSGDVWGVWDSTMNPIVVIGELRVPEDSSLYIGPGCYIEFQGYYALTLDTSAAFIRAIGTEEDSIVFTSAFGRVWNGIDIFCADSICVFSYCVLEKASTSEDYSGGAIYCELTDLDVRHCRITNNRAYQGMGGGIFVDWGEVFLSDNIISNNFSAFGGSGLGSYGGNIAIINNLFENDTTYYPLGGEMSGSIGCTGCSLLTFKNNTIKNNLSYSVGAVRLSSSIASITNNVVINNLGWTGRSGFWITIEDSGTVAFNEITHNGSVNSGGFRGSGITLFGWNVDVNNNLLAFNKTGSSAGGFYIVGTNIKLINNIIAYNRAYNGGGIYIDNTSTQIPNILTNNIIWGNVADYNPQIYNVANKPLEVSYCDVEDGWPGVGNIDIDPLFRDTANGDFHLMSTFCGDPYDSPCIDVGDPALLDSLLDCDWGLGFLPSDMGAYGGGDSAMQAADDYQPPLPIEPVLLQNYPNPFNSATTIEFALPEAGEVSLTIYDILGREVLRPVRGYKEAGRHSVTVDMDRAASGFYFYILSTEKTRISRTMVLIK